MPQSKKTSGVHRTNVNSGNGKTQVVLEVVTERGGDYRVFLLPNGRYEIYKMVKEKDGGVVPASANYEDLK